jgi:hypothetical protein
VQLGVGALVAASEPANEPPLVEADRLRRH